MKPSSKLIQFFFIVLLSSFSLHSFAEQFSNEDSLVKAMKILEDESITSPDDFFKTIEQYADIARKNHWRQTELALILLKIEQLINLERVSDGGDIFNKYKEAFYSFTQEEYLVRSIIVDLAIADAEIDHESIKKKRAVLHDKIEDIDDDSLKSHVYNALGFSYYREGKLLNGLKFYSKAYMLLIADDTSNELTLSGSINSIANIYSSLGDEETAIKYFKQTEVILEKHNDRIGGSVVAFNLGYAYENLKQPDNAFSAYNRSLKLSLEINDDVGAAWAKNGLARYYIGAKDYESALMHYLDTAETFKLVQSKDMYLESLLGVALSYVYLNNTEKAKNYIDLSEALLKDFDYFVIKKKHLTVIIKYHAAIGDYKKAYQLSEELLTLTRDLNRESNSKNIQRFKAEYEAEAAEAKTNALQQKMHYKA